MNISLSNLIFGILPFFLIIFEAWLIRSEFENTDGKRFPRIIYLFAFLIGLVPIVNFATSIVGAVYITSIVLDPKSDYRLRTEKGFLYWLFRRD